MNVTITNLGANPENVTLTFYANGTTVGYESISNLANGTMVNQVFQGNTSTLGYGNYILTGYCQLGGSGEAANNFTCTTTLTVSVPGDVNGDFKVNMKDMVLVARAFGSDGPNYLYPGSPPSSNWNPNADINDDGTVNMRDIALCARNFGQHYP
jgi:hypothetical protein